MPNGSPRKSIVGLEFFKPLCGFLNLSTRLRDRPFVMMGHPGSVSRQVGIVKRDSKLQKQANELERMC